ncbi:MAG: hypothetical protein HQL31_04785 [Planctomycetes bacterium]|nr:hypothetical protein [Planctomycetota bacterium]
MGLFLSRPKSFAFPKRCEIMLHEAGSEYLERFCAGYSTGFFQTNGDFCINVPAFLLSMTSTKFWSGRVLEAYNKAYLRLSGARLILTVIDNNTNFYLISGACRGVTTMMVQNGTRDDFLANLSGPWHVDYMLVMGRCVENYMKKISGTIVLSGSVISNEISVNRAKKSRRVVFFSQYRYFIKYPPLYVVGKLISWEDIYTAEEKVLPSLAAWCASRGLELVVAGCAPSEVVEREKQFYEQLLDGHEWSFKAKRDSSSYRLADDCLLGVSINSTIGFESFGRGNRTAIFMVRGACLGLSGYSLGLKEAENEYPFITFKPDEREYFRILDYLLGVGDEEWNSVCERYREEIMFFDPGNTVIRSLIKKVLEDKPPRR